MRITYLHQYFNTPEMSGSTRSFEMGKRLVQMGHEVNLITSWREKCNEPKEFKTIEDGINVYWLPAPYSNYMSYNQRIISFFKFAIKSYQKAISIPSDVIFASSTPLTIAIPGVYASRKLKIPFVFEVRDLWPELPIAVGAIKNPLFKFFARQLERFAYKNSDAIVALSKGMKDGILLSGYKSDQISVIPNASDLKNFNPTKSDKTHFRLKYGIPVNSIVILYPGTFGKINGVTYLVNLAQRFLTDSRVFFLTVGDGQEFDEVKRLAMESGCINNNFLMLNKVPKKDVPNIFECADIVISTVIPLPELEANSANKFFDGLAAGCCIALNHSGWQADLIESEGCGFTLSQNIDSASTQLNKLLEYPDKIIDAGKKGRLVAEKYFDRYLLANELESVLVNVCKKTKENSTQIIK